MHKDPPEIYLVKIIGISGDAVTKRFCSDKIRFADLVNGVYFGGQCVIHSEDLTDSSEGYAQPVEQSGQEEREYLERVREWLCGLKKTDRLWPTYTLCLYLGEEPWDGPRSLRDMMDFGDDVGDMSDQFADYPFRLYCVNEEQDFSMFHTQLRRVFELLPLRKDKKGLIEKLTEDDAYSHMDEDSLEFLSVVMDNPAIWKNRYKYKKNVADANGVMNDEQEEYDMCQAIRELIEDGKQEGIKEGIKEGRLQILIDMVKEGILKIDDAAHRCDLSVEEFCEQM